MEITSETVTRVFEVTHNNIIYTRTFLMSGQIIWWSVLYQRSLQGKEKEDLETLFQQCLTK